MLIPFKREREKYCIPNKYVEFMLPPSIRELILFLEFIQVNAQLQSKLEALQEHHRTLKHVYKEDLNRKLQDLDDLEIINKIRNMKKKMRESIKKSVRRPANIFV